MKPPSARTLDAFPLDALAQHHGVEAIAACLGYNRVSPKNSNPVTDLQLVKQIVLTFSILSFNRYDKSRIRVIGVEHGIVALVDSLIRITRSVAPSALLLLVRLSGTKIELFVSYNAQDEDGGR